MRSFNEKTIETTLGPLAGIEWPARNNNNQITIIALHGWLDNAASFIPLAEHLNDYHIIALDLPGHGHSGHMAIPNFYQMHDFVRWLMLAADQLELDRFAVIGHSLGAIISSLWCLTDKRITELYWIDAIGGLAREEEQSAIAYTDAIHALNRLQPRKPTYNSFELAVESRISGNLPVSKEAAWYLCSRGLEHLPDGRWTWRNDKALMLPTPIRLNEKAIQNLLSEVSVPVSVIVAKQGWLGSEPNFVTERAKQIQDIKRFDIDGGHHLHMDEAAIDIAQIIKQNLME